MNEYQRWIDEQTEKVASSVNRLAAMGIYEGAVYVLPSTPERYGELVVSRVPVVGASDVLRFAGGSDRVASVPRSQLRQALWEACRRMPVLKP